MDTCPSGSPPRVYLSAKRAAGTAPHGVHDVDRDTWIRTSDDVFAMRRKSKNGLLSKVPPSQEQNCSVTIMSVTPLWNKLDALL